VEFDPHSDYPLGTKRPDLVRTPSGVPAAGVTLEALRSGELAADDIRATPETLRRQAAVARAAGRAELAENLERAAELATVPEDVILTVYTALRPRRSSAAALAAWADRLETEHGATRTAAFVREAAAVYAERELLALADDPSPVDEHVAAV
jgi:propanediol dehydratase small subunit